MDRDAVVALLAQSVPFNRVLGVEVLEIGDGEAIVRMPSSPDRLNHVGTVHAAAQFGLGEAAAGACVVARFGDLQAHGIVPLAVDASIHYLRPAGGALRAAAALDAESVNSIREDALAGNKPRFPVHVRIFDEVDRLTTEMSVTWVLMRV